MLFYLTFQNLKKIENDIKQNIIPEIVLGYTFEIHRKIP